MILRLDEPLTEIVVGIDPELPSKLLSELGFNDFFVKRDGEGAPIWPDGVVGSISNIRKKSQYTAVSLSRELKGLGIDIELLSRAENAFRSKELFLKEKLEVTPLQSLLCFSAKEAVYKAIYPIIKSRFWFSAVSVVGIEDDQVILEPKEQLIDFGFKNELFVEYKLLGEICFTMLRLS